VDAQRHLIRWIELNHKRHLLGVLGRAFQLQIIGVLAALGVALAAHEGVALMAEHPRSGAGAEARGEPAARGGEAAKAPTVAERVTPAAPVLAALFASAACVGGAIVAAAVLYRIDGRTIPLGAFRERAFEALDRELDLEVSCEGVFKGTAYDDFALRQFSQHLRYWRNRGYLGVVAEPLPASVTLLAPLLTIFLGTALAAAHRGWAFESKPGDRMFIVLMVGLGVLFLLTLVRDWLDTSSGLRSIHELANLNTEASRRPSPSDDGEPGQNGDQRMTTATS
jgi:hypothetical protein